ncbi:hypothetical protein [Mesorhizobium sp. Mes31]|uniref:hypothetical protein n=1 Tax=Mesorhizobium sp. Mes31 TaxID=2926017 RepID=UPI0021181B29|nr:hypothetical protein [Mesorhizobium sp. Mes31]
MTPAFHKTLKDGFEKPLDCLVGASPTANQSGKLVLHQRRQRILHRDNADLRMMHGCPRKLVTGLSGSVNPNRLRRTVGRGARNDHD